MEQAGLVEGVPGAVLPQGLGVQVLPAHDPSELPLQEEIPRVVWLHRDAVGPLLSRQRGTAPTCCSALLCLP